MPSSRGPYWKITTLNVVIAAIVAAGLGIAALFFGGRESLWSGHKGIQAFVNGVGGALIGAVALGILWELVGKRALVDEMHEKFEMSADVKTAGLVGIGTNYVADPDWDSYFAGVSKLDIFVAYGQTWRNQHLTQLREVARRPDARIHVYLPDPEDATELKALARKFGSDLSSLRQKIEETRAAFQELAQPGGAEVTVYYRPPYSVFSFYRFDSTAVITLYSHSRRRQPGVPTLICKAGGSLFQFVYDEISALRDVCRPA
ncbi:hypothetical protein [Actinomadura geliboluensis]|uniref:hypothetical protein n=1 Tax=Actinomadura geliboluensis TaxID=882440 RepID=UPI0037110AF6